MLNSDMVNFPCRARRLAHVSDDDLEEYIMNRLEGQALEKLEEHLLICDRCREYLVETEKTIRIIREAMRRLLANQRV